MNSLSSSNLEEVIKNINTIAIPTNWIEYFYDNEKEVVVIKKRKPKSPEYIAGAAHRFRFELPIYIKGGIKIFNGHRKLKYAEISINNDDIEYKGYLVFEKVNENEWKITTKEPEVYIYTKHYYLESRTGSARYEILKTKNVLFATTRSTSTAIDSVAAIMLILPTDKPAYIEYSKTMCPYRGKCENIIKDIKIEWNNGNPEEKETIFPDDDIEIIWGENMIPPISKKVKIVLINKEVLEGEYHGNDTNSVLVKIGEKWVIIPVTSILYIESE